MNKIYQVDAFTNNLFSGNPAAVCPLTQWLPDTLMQKIALENNLSETAFYVKEKDDFHIRWFTPEIEVDLCGHATLATAHVLFHHEHYTGNKIIFKSRSGPLSVERRGSQLVLDFPTDTLKQIAPFPELIQSFGITPIQAFQGKTDYMLIFEREDQIRNARPDLAVISKLKTRGVIITAKGSQSDFVSRFFAPEAGVTEDPVTGSAHTSLIPYWAKILEKNELTAIQLSARGGHLACKYMNDRVEIGGQARTFLIGNIFLE
jgi:PhzF family phenazine biosynthesis protein